MAALAPAASMPLAYLAITLVIELTFARSELPAWLVAAVAAACAGVALFARLAYDRIVRRPTPPSPRRLVKPLVGAIAGALLVLPLRVGGRPSPAASDERPLAPRTAKGRVPPLLLVGLDSGNWHTLRPMLDRGRVPTLARLIAAGVHGTVETLWPPYLVGAGLGGDRHRPSA